MNNSGIITLTLSCDGHCGIFFPHCTVLYKRVYHEYDHEEIIIIIIRLAQSLRHRVVVWPAVYDEDGDRSDPRPHHGPDRPHRLHELHHRTVQRDRQVQDSVLLLLPAGRDRHVHGERANTRNRNARQIYLLNGVTTLKAVCTADKAWNGLGTGRG